MRGLSVDTFYHYYLPIPDFAIVCQAFKDVAGRIRLGKTFNTTSGKDRFSKTPIRVGSIFCSDAAAVDAYIKQRPVGGIPVVHAVPIPFVNVAIILGDLEGHGFSTSLDVLVDDSIFLIPGLNSSNQAFISEAGGGVERSQVSCQVYEDKEATKLWTELRGEEPRNLSPDYAIVPVGSVRCKRISETV